MNVNLNNRLSQNKNWFLPTSKYIVVLFEQVHKKEQINDIKQYYPVFI